MITYLRHADIDLAAWDRRMDACESDAWYGLSATLNAASPGWDALVDDDTGAQMPLPWRSKFGIRYLYQPFVVQHLGPFSQAPSPEDSARFLAALPMRFRFADVYLRAGIIPASSRTRTEERINHILRIDPSLEDIRAGYSVNHRRSLRKAAQLGVEVETHVNAKRVIDFLESSEQFKKWKVDAAQLGTMRRVLMATETDGSGFGRMVSHGGSPVAAAWFVRWKDRVIFLKGMGSAEGRELRAMHALIDHVIAEQAANAAVLDFAGGNDPQFARFYSGFGAEPAVYLRALVDRLPPLIRLMKH